MEPQVAATRQKAIPHRDVAAHSQGDAEHNIEAVLGQQKAVVIGCWEE